MVRITLNEYVAFAVSHFDPALICTFIIIKGYSGVWRSLYVRCDRGSRGTIAFLNQARSPNETGPSGSTRCPSGIPSWKDCPS